MRREASTFAMGFHEAPRPALCWVQIGLHVPHNARPTWLLRHNLLGGRQCPMEGRQKSRSKLVLRAVPEEQ
jgi:hypothetical protein